MDGESSEDPTLFPEKVGEKLRDARLAQGLELSDVAARTRVPLRHLQAIEASDYSGLPSPTYAVGFVKAYARAVGADEVALAKQLREETSDLFAAREAYETYDPEEPVREPPSGLAWAGAVIAVLLLAAVGLWYGTDLFRGGGGEPEPSPTPPAAAAPAVDRRPLPRRRMAARSRSRQPNASGSASMTRAGSGCSRRRWRRENAMTCRPAPTGR